VEGEELLVVWIRRKRVLPRRMELPIASLRLAAEAMEALLVNFVLPLLSPRPLLTMTMLLLSLSLPRLDLPR